MGNKRRAKGEGSIVRHKSTGLWAYAIELPQGSDGKRKRRFLYAKTKSELMRKITDLRAAGGGSIAPRAVGTVGEWVEKWLEDVRLQLRPNTYFSYKGAWRLHAQQLLGSVQLEKFDVDHVRGLYAELDAKGIGGAAVHKLSVAMTRAFNVAIKEGRYRKANPFSLVGAPRHTPQERRALSASEARAFIKACRDDRYEAAWILMLTAGTRLGETLGLEWTDVDLRARTVTIRQAVVEVGGRSEVAQTKTKGSRRSIDIGVIAAEALRRRKQAASKERLDTDFVFVTPIGTHPGRSNLRRDSLDPIAKKARIKGLTPHGLRHTSATMSLVAGTSPKTVAARLGHADPRLTMALYSHYVPELGKQAARDIDALLAPKRISK